MKVAALLTAAVALASAGEAFADGLPTPTVPLPTVPTPALPTLPQLPTLAAPAPKIPVHVSTPSAPSSGSIVHAVSGAAGSAPAPVGSSVSSSSGWSSSGTYASSSSSPASPARPAAPRIARLRSSRPWISKSGRGRTTVLHFRLTRAARILFRVIELAPSCRVAGTFAVNGHAGLNRIHFNGRIHGRTLEPGTYSIRARRIHGRAVLRVVLVVVAGGSPSPTELETARHASVCGATRALSDNGSTSGGQLAAATNNTGGTNGGSKASKSAGSSGVAGASASSGSHAAVASAAPFSPARVSKNATNPLVILAFALAVALLGLAALPKEAVPDPRLTDVLARHRVEVALAGAAALAAALLALALA